MSVKRALLLVAASVTTTLTLWVIIYGLAVQRDIIRDDIDHVISLCATALWILFASSGRSEKVEARFNALEARLGAMEQRIVDYGDERATDGRLTAIREIGNLTEPSPGGRAEAGSHLRIAGNN